MLDETKISELTPYTLLERENFFDLAEMEPEEQARISALLILKAKEFGIQKEYKVAMKAFAEADKALALEYKKANARKNSKIDIDFDSKGTPSATIENYVKVLENDPKFADLKFNLLTYSPEQIRDGKAVKWTDADDVETQRYIEKEYGFYSAQKCDGALRLVFSKNQYHPVRDYVDSIKWDGISRIYTFLAKWTKCEDTPYTREVSRLIFAGGIHRLYNPGCKFDDMPVLIGKKQGEGKSTLVRWLALKDEYFTEVNEFEGQKGIESIEGAWICEVSELLALTKTKEQEAVKGYLTRLNDRYRMPFDKRTTDHLRQCIFIGTTNKEQFLTDKTGNRRFYPVVVHQTGYELFDNEEAVKADIRQCWAEAKQLYLDGKLAPCADRTLVEVIRQKQQEAVEDDYRVGMISAYLANKSEVCVLELWKNALDMGEYSKPTKKDSNEIGLIMQNFSEWEKQKNAKRFSNFGLQRWWKHVYNDIEVLDEDEDVLI